MCKKAKTHSKTGLIFQYQYLSYKYGLIEADLLGKIKKKMLLLHPQPVLCGILKELCGIRDNTSSCDIANNNEIVALINDIIMYR